jgi:hypothetical protein
LSESVVVVLVDVVARKKGEFKVVAYFVCVCSLA